MFLVFLLFFSFSGQSANTVIDQAEDVARKLHRDKSLILEKEQKQREILSSLFQLNQKIKKLSKEKSDLAAEKRLLQFTIADLQLRNQELSEGLKVKGRELINHIRWIQQAKDLSWLNAISGSRGPAEADLNFYIFTKLRDQEKKRIKNYVLEKKQLKQNEKKLQARLERLNRISKELVTKEQDSLTQQNQRKAALDQIRNQKHQVLKRMKNFRNTRLVQKLEDTGLLDGLIKASFMEEKGLLRLPASGSIRQRFGIVKTADSTYYKNHKGIFIQSRPTADVAAVFEGKVAFVGSVGGFGKTLILDHGDHYYTVYSSLSSVDVVEGQQVGKYQAVGKVGSSGFYEDPGVYFEVRHFSEPQDPQDWIKEGAL